MEENPKHENEEKNDLLSMMYMARDEQRADALLAREKFAQTSKQRLLEVIETKLRTTFIAALAAVEKEYGAGWGHKRKPRDMTPTELAQWDRYQRLRNAILNSGNNQIRAMQAEVQLYDIRWVGYQYVGILPTMDPAE